MSLCISLTNPEKVLVSSIMDLKNNTLSEQNRTLQEVIRGDITIPGFCYGGSQLPTNDQPHNCFSTHPCYTCHSLPSLLSTSSVFHQYYLLFPYYTLSTTYIQLLHLKYSSKNPHENHSLSNSERAEHSELLFLHHTQAHLICREENQKACFFVVQTRSSPILYNNAFYTIHYKTFVSCACVTENLRLFSVNYLYYPSPKAAQL